MMVDKFVNVENLECVESVMHYEWLPDKAGCIVIYRQQMGCSEDALEVDYGQVWVTIFMECRFHHPHQENMQLLKVP
jgi:hypothetical protein